jgi:hypothetical protein
VVGDHGGNVTSGSDKVIAGTINTAAHRGPVALNNVTPSRKVDTASSAQSTMLVARRGTGEAGTSLYKEGNTKEKLGATPTVTGSLGKKPDIVGAAANTTIKGSLLSSGVTDTIVTGINAGLTGVIDPTDNCAKSGRVPSQGGCRPTTAHNTTRSASQGKLNKAKIPQGPNVPSPKASKSGRIPDVKIIKTPVNGGTAGMEQLSGLPIERGNSYRYGHLNCKRISGH